MKKSLLKKSQIPLKKTSLKKENTISAKKKHEQRIIQKEKDDIFYKQIFIDRGRLSDLTGKIILGELSSFNCHHLLPKEKHPQFRYKQWNILFCEGQWHSQIETNPFLLPEELYERYIIFLNYAKQKAGI